MATKALVGVSTIKYGTVVGDGSMPTSLTAWELFVPDSVLLQFDEPEKTDLYVEGQDAPYITIPDPKRVRALLFRSRNLEPTALEDFFGGTVATNTWSAPTAETAIFYAIEVVSKTYDTTLYTIEIPKALILSSLDGKLYQTDTGEISVRAEIQAVDNAGTPQSPIQISKTN